MTNLDRPCRTIADVNKLLARAGHHERLCKGEGYVYWHSGTTPQWPESIVYVYRLTDLTIREYIEDHQYRVQQHLNR